MLSLPKLIAHYVSLPSDASTDELGCVLAEDAVVRDEHRAHQGLQAIRAWRIDTMSPTPFEVRPHSVENQCSDVVPQARS